MRVILKECAWETLGDDLIVVHDPREAFTLADPGGRIAALLDELGRGPATAEELSAVLTARGFAARVGDVRDGLDGLDSLGLVENADERWLGEPDADEHHFSNLTFFGSFTGLHTSRAEFVRRLRDSHVLVLGAGGGGSSLVQCLAGLGVGALVAVLSLLLGARLLIQEGLWAPPAPVDATLAVWVFVKLAGLLWQCMIFLRTDLYAVLVNALGCRDLWRVKTLLLRRAFGRLTPEQAEELAGAAPADLRVGRWFRWLWLAGFVGVLAWFVFFVVPVAVTVLRWAADGLLLGPFSLRFWYSLLCTALLLGPEALAICLTAKEYALRARVGAWRARRARLD
ncbi:hypothetical protein [Microtetraspora malaysiensis]|uniref:hypothetical protein n=1 Tax=Microtetraspora malaysiensis TaxID=161358 RepID=UPI003D89EF39